MLGGPVLAGVPIVIRMKGGAARGEAAGSEVRSFRVAAARTAVSPVTEPPLPAETLDEATLEAEADREMIDRTDWTGRRCDPNAPTD